MEAHNAVTVTAQNEFRLDLQRLEEQAVGGFDLIVSQLDRALESLKYQDVELAGMVVEGDAQIDRCHLAIHRGVMSLLPHQAPLAEDWRLVAALLPISRCIERIGDQCVNIGTLIPLSGHEPPKDLDILEMVDRMGRNVRQQLLTAKDSFRMRHVSLAQDLVRQDEAVNRLNREIFQRAVDVGDDHEMREWAMFMTLVARCLERIGDNAVDIAEHTVFVVTGTLRDLH